jgi:predicted helicase
MSRLAISQYYRDLDQIIQYGGRRNESQIRFAFQRLLNEYCQPKDFLVVAELDYRTKRGNLIRLDGVVKDALRLEWGYWEAKDEDDDLEKEIEKKLAKGYPDDNILFEDSQTAILLRQGEVCWRVAMRDEQALDQLLTEFINYERPEVKDFRSAIAVFNEDLPTILIRLREMINEQSENNVSFVTARDKFLGICQQSINPEVNRDDVREMIIQHILTEDIFTNIFNESQFHRENNIASELGNVINTFFIGSVRRNMLGSIEHYYGVIRRTAANIYNHQEKQKFLKAIYENFYKAYNPKAADRLGIVYTPSEIVKFMIESVDYLLDKHFGKLLQDKNVEILDPATGTGTFITELIEYINKDKLKYKYQHEIHCNEVAILPYYIANLNIEFTYKQKMGEYEEFNNICLVDTLDRCDLGEKQFDLFAMSAENTARIKEQNSRKISVIIGNPPYNAWQDNYNQNNANLKYKEIDKRINASYIKAGTAQNQIAVYDMYVRFYRWASDRIKNNGLIAFITNRSFIDGKTFDGFRKIVEQEFDYIYIVDAGGDIRSGDKSGNVFNIKTGVAVMFLVKIQKED